MHIYIHIIITEHAIELSLQAQQLPARDFQASNISQYQVSSNPITPYPKELLGLQSG